MIKRRSAQQPSSVTHLVPDPSAPGRSPSLTLNADTVIAGIRFHLLDRGHAQGVDDQTVHHALCRLKRTQFKADVTRSAWEAMSDPERLQWLLAVSDTAYTLRDDHVAVLKRRRG
jgi:hypothetical protein